ncbi:MAG TPA: undecaprenyl-diphosphatase UppP [Anaerolineales bacterium]|nr:undecaprenyl-diphosphatase UppP [Anaerolineales bacterium]
MTLFHAFILGIVQGLTEFIPVSSTAHLLIAEKILGLPSDDRTFSFSVIVQLGTVFALLLFFWKDFWRIAEAFFLGIEHKNPFENLQARLGWLVIVATIPALVAGFFLKDIVQSRFSDPFTQAGLRLLVTAVLLTAVEYFDRRERTLESATWLDALSVGLFQVLAIFPGASRSGSTIAGGMVRGFDRPSAARFAFLMSAPIMLAAGGYESLKVIDLPGTHAFLPYLVTGFISAAVVGWLAIKWLLAYLSRHSLYGFAVYCAILGVLVLAAKLFL